MSKIEEIKFDSRGIGNFISDKFLFVPIYQRDYAWEEKQVSELLQDITASIKSGEYFIGSIVVSNENGNNLYEIIDGQQRVATIIILFSAIRNYYHKVGENNLCEEIETKFLRSFDRNRREFIPKIKLNNVDNDYFQKLVINRVDEIKESFRPSRESHNRIKSAFEHATKHVDNVVKPFGGKPEELIVWTNFIEEKLKVISVIVPDIADAYTIFETLNDRGKALATTDLIKNYLFKVSKDRIMEAKDSWIKMIAVIEAALKEEEVETFIKYYWSSLYGFTRIRDRNLFKQIRGNIKSPHEVVSLTNNLQRYSERYVALFNPNHNLWDEYPPSSKDYVRILNTLKVTQYLPLMLAIIEKFSLNDVNNSLRFLIDWFVRNLITGNLGGGTIEQLYSEKAVDVMNEKIKTAKQLKDTLKEYTPTDDYFRAQFQIARVSQSYLARYYLRALENQSSGQGHPELVPNENTEVVNLEHILPQNPNDIKNDWPSFNEESHQANFKRLGNLVLISSKLNNKISNGSFQGKKNELAKSVFKLTSSISKFNDWDPGTIEERQKELSDLALKTWNLIL